LTKVLPGVEEKRTWGGETSGLDGSVRHGKREKVALDLTRMSFFCLKGVFMGSRQEGKRERGVPGLLSKYFSVEYKEGKSVHLIG